jgi:predicted nucleotidyltransferase
MDQEAALTCIAQFRAALEAKGIRIGKLVLFGSYATGQFHEGSDIDLMVISDDFEGKGYWERIDLLSSAIHEVFAPIEAVAMTYAEWEGGHSMLADFARDGIVLPVAT